MNKPVTLPLIVVIAVGVLLAWLVLGALIGPGDPSRLGEASGPGGFVDRLLPGGAPLFGEPGPAAPAPR